MGLYHFGAGNFFGISPGATPTPVRLGVLQDIDINFSGNIKELFGQNKFAAAVAQGQMKVQGKAKFASISAAAYNTLFFGQSAGAVAGQTKFVDMEPLTLTTNTGTVAQGAKFTLDLGAIHPDTGASLIRVATAPAVGQYSVTTAGVYTFNAEMTGKKPYVSYMWTDPAVGKTLTLTNSAMGLAPTFKGIFTGGFGGKQIVMVLNACVSSKLKLIDTKSEDFSIPELEFGASVDDAGVLGFLSTDE